MSDLKIVWFLRVSGSWRKFFGQKSDFDMQFGRMAHESKSYSGSGRTYATYSMEGMMSIRHFLGLFLVSITMFIIFGCATENKIPLIDAAKKGDSHDVESRLANGDDVNTKNESGWTALMAASWEGRREVVKLLLAKRADVNARDNGGQTALIMASTAGHREVAELLIAKGADVDAKANDGTTALMRASTFGHKNVEELLREHGAH
jgi:hypothetical protein